MIHAIMQGPHEIALASRQITNDKLETSAIIYPLTSRFAGRI